MMPINFIEKILGSRSENNSPLPFQYSGGLREKPSATRTAETGGGGLPQRCSGPLRGLQKRYALTL
jgi:hypothetical protein